MADQDLGSGVVQDHLDPFGGMPAVDRDVGGAQLERRQDRHELVRPRGRQTATREPGFTPIDCSLPAS